MLLNKSGPARDQADSCESALDLIEEQHEALRDWLKTNAAYVREQGHLKGGSAEQAYWHYGYVMALRDVLALLGNASTTKH